MSCRIPGFLRTSWKVGDSHMAGTEVNDLREGSRGNEGNKGREESAVRKMGQLGLVS